MEPRGAEVADRAREILLDEVVLPCNRLIGRFKKPDTLRGYADGACVAFARALETRPQMDGARREATLAVLDAIAGVFESAREGLRRRHDGDERKVWMPLGYALWRQTRARGVDRQIAHGVGRALSS